MFLGLWHKAQTLLSFRAENYPNTEAEAAEEISMVERDQEERIQKPRQLACGGPNPGPSLAAHGDSSHRAGDTEPDEQHLRRGHEDSPCLCRY